MTNTTIPNAKQPILIAHRGWSRHFPENSLPAFAAAIAAGADEIEFDVRVSSDNVPFICHDKQVDRVSDLHGLCSALSMADLRNAAIKMPDGTYLQGMGFPTFAEVLALFGGHIGMNVHVKELGKDQVALRVLAEYIRNEGVQRIYIAGNAAVLEAAQSICPELDRCCLDQDTDAAAMLKSAIRYNCQRIQYHHGHCEPGDVQNGVSAGLVANYYFTDTVQDAEYWLQAGVGGLLTNDIGMIRRHFSGLDTL